ncbi:MAG: DUF1524 domain-containing protein [Acidithiobacillus sp.]|nr:DUF1524 domain-containing protein [Acidithiobacillus sp.]
MVDSEKSYTLLPVLAVEMAQKSPDVYLLLLFWADRLMERDIDLSQIDEKEHRRTLGFLTALAWFAPDNSKACSAVWPELLESARSDQLIDFFNSISFQKTCKLDSGFKLRMIPLPTVEELDLFCQRKVTGYRGCQHTISSSDSVIWKEWNWYTSFTDLWARDVKEKWSRIIMADSTDQDMNESVTQIARHFLDTLYDSRSILLYAQREWMRKWYPDFDPSQPEFMEDKNRPWDYDHIHPQGLLRSHNGNSRRNIPQVIRDWHSSIGNLRAWPLEVNRSDSDAPPTIKLGSPNQADMIYNINTIEDIINASFVDNESLSYWMSSVPLNEDSEVEDIRYLANIREYHDNVAALLRAIITRFVKLYHCWYRELMINELVM